MSTPAATQAPVGGFTAATSVRTVSWIPSDAVTGPLALAMSMGLAHHDAPPPDEIHGQEHVAELARADGFRFSHALTARARFSGGVEGVGAVVVDHRVGGELTMGSSTMRVGPWHLTLPAPALPALESVETAVAADGVTTLTVTRTAGGRTAFPLPRRASTGVVRLTPPVVWTTLTIVLRADGGASWELTGASPFPRHWVYGPDGVLAAKVGLTDWDGWLDQEAERTPWGREDVPAVVTAAGSNLERRLAGAVMAARPRVSRVPAGTILLEQGRMAEDLILLLDGVVTVTTDGKDLAQLGPGSVLGERAFLEGGRRTATVTAATPVRLVRCAPERLQESELADLALEHRREASLG